MTALQDSDAKVKFLSSFEDFVDDRVMAETESLRIRTELMLTLQRYIQEQQWDLEEAARAFRQPLPRMQNLLNGEISRFTVEDLIYLLTKVGMKMQVSVQSSPALPRVMMPNLEPAALFSELY